MASVSIGIMVRMVLLVVAGFAGGAFAIMIVVAVAGSNHRVYPVAAFIPSGFALSFVKLVLVEEIEVDANSAGLVLP